MSAKASGQKLITSDKSREGLSVVDIGKPNVKIATQTEGMPGIGKTPPTNPGLAFYASLGPWCYRVLHHLLKNLASQMPTTQRDSQANDFQDLIKLKKFHHNLTAS